MSSPDAFWNGFTFLIIGTALSIILVLFVGIGVDGTIGAMEDIDVLDVGGEWGSAATQDIYWWQSYAYMVAISPAILGVIAIIVAAVQREKVEEETYMTSQFSEEIDI